MKLESVRKAGSGPWGSERPQGGRGVVRSSGREGGRWGVLRSSGREGGRWGVFVLRTRRTKKPPSSKNPPPSSKKSHSREHATAQVQKFGTFRTHRRTHRACFSLEMNLLHGTSESIVSILSAVLQSIEVNCVCTLASPLHGA